MGGSTRSQGSRRSWLRGVLGVVIVLVAFVGASALAAAHAPVRTNGTTDLREGRFPIDEVVVGDPVLADGLVVLPLEDGYVAYDIETGDRRWRSEVCDWPESAAPAGVHQASTLVVTCGGELTMLDLSTGRFEWSRDDVWGWTMLRASEDVVAISLSDEVLVVDAGDGSDRFRWSPGSDQYEEMTVAVSDELVLIGTDYRVEAFDHEGEQEWSREAVPSSVWAVDDLVLVREPSQWFRSLESQTGEEIHRERLLDATTPYSMIVGGGDGVAVLALSRTESMLYAVDARSTEFLWATDDGTWFRDHFDGTISVMDLEGCAALRASDGEELYRCPEGAFGLGVDARRVAVVTGADDGGAELWIEVVRVDR